MVKRLGTTVRSEPVPLEAGAAQKRWGAFVAQSPDASVVGRAFPLLSREAHIGREPAPGPHVRIALADDRMSRLHASVLVDVGSARIADCNSSNGLFVDGRRVSGAVLAPGSVVRLGDTLLVIQRGEGAPADDDHALEMVGRSPAVAALRALIRVVAPSTIAALIIGETGTGKELVARALHSESHRPGRFVPVNCAALPAPLVESTLFGHRKGAFTGATSDQDGAFTQADGGTLFLDEIGELTLESQPKLLRVLEDGEVTPVGAGRASRVDVRIVTATNRPLQEAAAAGRFREDLLARLSGVHIATPALRERREDIPQLFQFFAQQAARPGSAAADRAMSADFVEALLLAAWPQNVRELAKLAQRLCLLAADAPGWELAMPDEALSRPVTHRASEDDARAGVGEGNRGPPTRDELLALLARFQGNVSLVANVVKRNRKQVYRWMDDLGIDRGTGR